MVDVKANVSADLVYRANLCRSWEETRYYLNGVFIHPAKAGGVMVVATDGQTLAVLHDPHGFTSHPVIIMPDRKFISWCRNPKARKGFKGSARVVLSDGKLHGIFYVEDERFDEFAAVMNPSRIEVMQWREVMQDGATFPNYSRAVSRNKLRTLDCPIGFNPKYIERAGAVLGEKGVARGLTLMKADHGSTVPLFAFCPGSEISGFMVLMHMKINPVLELPKFWNVEHNQKEI